MEKRAEFLQQFLHNTTLQIWHVRAITARGNSFFCFFFVFVPFIIEKISTFMNRFEYLKYPLLLFFRAHQHFTKCYNIDIHINAFSQNKVFLRLSPSRSLLKTNKLTFCLFSRGSNGQKSQRACSKIQNNKFKNSVNVECF